jgi:hypothetical protein
MKPFFKAMSVIFGLIAIIGMLAAAQPIGDLLSVLNPNVSMSNPPASERLLNCMLDLSRMAIPMMACLLFWYAPDMINRNKN